ncbi:MAG: LacI family DNA-binding transcriptional regulator [Faecalibacterium sp.]
MAATIKDIARETGLSLATISKYMNGGNLREENRAAIEKAIKKLDYTVNEYARGLKSNRSRAIGVLIPELSNLFITQIITVVEGILQEKGYSVVICDCHTDEARECAAVQFLLSKKVDGIINMPVCRDGRHLTPALEQGVPVVLIDRIVPSLKGEVDSILIDNKSAAEEATDHLLEKGHRDIAIIAGPEHIYTSKLRLSGYYAAFASRGLTPPEYELYVRHCDYTVQGGYESMRKLLTQTDCTAVFVTNYEMTLGAMIAVNELGRKIPEDISIIGFDNMDLSRITHPRLTIVTQPLEQIGYYTAKTLLERLESKDVAPVRVSLSTTLQDGASVRSL